MNETDLGDKDAMKILEHLRSKVREFGFGELDSDIEKKLVTNGADPGVDALEKYFADLHSYLRIFDSDSIKSTQEQLESSLKGDWSWRLLPGGDPEIRRSSVFAYSEGIQDMTVYRAIGELRSLLAVVMRELGIDVPGGSGDGKQERT